METAEVVLVTNVGQGFGRAVAIAFGRAAYDVVCADRDVDLASKTAAEIEELGGQAIPIQADMSTLMDVLAAFQKVDEIFGDLSGVVHVADHASHSPFATLAENEFAELLDEDLKSCFLTLRVATRLLSDGWVVLITPPADDARPAMRAVIAAIAELAAGVADTEPELRINVVTPSRPASDPTHDRDLVEVVAFLGSEAAEGIRGQRLYAELPPPPRVVESLLPEVLAALDPSVRQIDLEADLEEADEADGTDDDRDSDLDGIHDLDGSDDTDDHDSDPDDADDADDARSPGRRDDAVVARGDGRDD